MLVRKEKLHDNLAFLFGENLAFFLIRNCFKIKILYPVFGWAPAKWDWEQERTRTPSIDSNNFCMTCLQFCLVQSG